jgi:hypothetical protein
LSEVALNSRGFALRCSLAFACGYGSPALWGFTKLFCIYFNMPFFGRDAFSFLMKGRPDRINPGFIRWHQKSGIQHFGGLNYSNDPNGRILVLFFLFYILYLLLIFSVLMFA